MRIFCLVFSFLLILSMPLFGSAELVDSADGIKFKEEYEMLNGQSNLDGSRTYASLEIPEDNCVTYTDPEGVQALLEQGTGVLYLGFPECPWCRTLIPVLFEAVREAGFEGNIYYYNALDDRDFRYLDEDGNIVVEEEGAEIYLYLMEKLYDYLAPYGGLNDESVKRIYFPTTVFVREGEILSVHRNTVESQTDGYVPLDEAQHQELLNALVEQLSAVNGLK